MGWLDGLKAFFGSVDTEYDRRIRAASNVKAYHVDGHGAHDDHSHNDHVERIEEEDLEYLDNPDVDPEVEAVIDDNQPITQVEYERLQGEGGAVGELQSNAGPQNEP